MACGIAASAAFCSLEGWLNASLDAARHQGIGSVLSRRSFLTLADTVEFFNLVTETKLTAQEKSDLVAFLRQL